MRDLNTLYRGVPALHVRDFSPDGFEWIVGDAADESIFAWVRRGEETDAPAVVISNFTPVERSGWTCGLPLAGNWREALNTDAGRYGGGDRGNMGVVKATGTGWHGQPASANLTIPPLGTLILTYEGPGD